jgi:hypothetical protein
MFVTEMSFRKNASVINRAELKPYAKRIREKRKKQEINEESKKYIL